MPVRLLFLTAETCPTFRADVAILFGKYLPRLGVYSDIVTGQTPGNAGAAVWDKGNLFLCNVSGGQISKHFKMLWHGIIQLINADPALYQAIQVRDMPLLATFGLLAAKIKRLPFYYWMSYPIPEGQIALASERKLSAGWIKFFSPWVRGWVGYFLLYHLVLHWADHIFVQSDRMKRDMIKRGFLGTRMTAVPMGVDLEELKPGDIQSSNDPRLNGRRVIVYLGTLDRPRKIEVLFEMMAGIRQQVEEALLVLVGDTEDDSHRHWLKHQAEAAGVARHVLWTGWLPMREGWSYVRAAEVALSPIPRGPLLDVSSPTKVPEYMALGVPVVCNDNPDQADLIQRCGAGICVPYTSVAFTSAVLEILKGSQKDHVHKASSIQSCLAKSRSYEHISEQVASTYFQVLGFGAK